MSWLWWVLIGVAALAGEAASMALFLLYVGVAAFVAAVLAFVFPLAVVAQLAVFVVLSVLLVGLVRPRMLQTLTGRVPTHALTNQGMLIDRVATVTQAVTRDAGMIRIGNAEFWTARVNPPTESIAVGSRVRVAYVDGLTAYVDPIQSSDDGPLTSEAPFASGVPVAPEMAREEK